ncbi:hypothetical protein [Acetobacter sp.]|uniref:hypothetical protein n=1 Tax=Acetobacter sp. TaxID=440 RepID=UPI0039E837F8
MTAAVTHKDRKAGRHRLPEILSRWRVLSLCGILAACQAAPVVKVEPTPHTLVYSYLMAHGMARGAVMSGGMNARQLLDLIRADHEALLAVAHESSAPGSTNLKAANEAVERLIAATQPLDGAPAIPTGAIRTTGSR